MNKVLGVVVGLVAAGAGGYQIYRSVKGTKVEIEWTCSASGPTTLKCDFTATEGSGEACFDAVVVCDDGEHVARACSGKVEKKQTVSKEITAFKPPINPVVPCSKIETRNKKVQ